MAGKFPACGRCSSACKRYPGAEVTLYNNSFGFMLWVVYTLCPAGQSRSRGRFGLSFLPPSSSLKSLPSRCLRRFGVVGCGAYYYVNIQISPFCESSRFRIRKHFFHFFEIIFVRKLSTLLRSLNDYLDK